jgi:hypothetical protein
MMAFIFKEYDGPKGIWHADHVLNFHVKIHWSSIAAKSEGNLLDTDIAEHGSSPGRQSTCPL